MNDYRLRHLYLNQIPKKMKTITKVQAQLLSHNWHSIAPQDIIKSVIRFSGDDYQRATAVSFGKVCPEFLENLEGADKIAVCLGLEWRIFEENTAPEPVLTMYFEFQLNEGGTKLYFGPDQTLFEYYESVSSPSTKHFGASGDYKERAIKNWLGTYYSEINDMFYIKTHMKSVLPLPIDFDSYERPRRFKKFNLTTSDLNNIQSLKDNIEKMTVFMSVTFGNARVDKASFDPIIELGTEGELPPHINAQVADEVRGDKKLTSEPESIVFLDFLRPCPPFGDCDDIN